MPLYYPRCTAFAVIGYGVFGEWPHALLSTLWILSGFALSSRLGPSDRRRRGTEYLCGTTASRLAMRLPVIPYRSLPLLPAALWWTCPVSRPAVATLYTRVLTFLLPGGAPPLLAFLSCCSLYPRIHLHCSGSFLAYPPSSTLTAWRGTHLLDYVTGPFTSGASRPWASLWVVFLPPMGSARRTIPRPPVALHPV